MEPKKYLKKTYPYSDALGSIAFPEHDMKRAAEDPFFRMRKLESAKDARQHKKFYTYISTDFQGRHIFIQSLQYTKILEVSNPDLGYSAAFQVIESMQISSLHSAPIIEVMSNFLEFIYDTVILPTNRKLIAKHFHPDSQEIAEPEDLETLILQRGPEFISTVAFQHLHFQEKILHNISLQFPKQKIEFNFRNVYQNNCEFKIENFNFELLFKKINNIDKILQLLRALLLEKKVIMIKQDISDVAILMQTLITLLQPFKWNYTVITNLPVEMIEALESPQPFLIGIQKQIWDSHCKIDMMDNIVEENFVIFDVDTVETRGLHDIYDPQTDSAANIQLQKDLKKKYQQLLSLKDELISSLPKAKKNGQRSPKAEKGYSEEKAEELYWVWFQLKIKQAIHHLYLNMLGNVQAGFRSKETLEELDRQKGENISCKDIFDFPKYLGMMKNEMKVEKLKFMETFVEKQAFIVFIEDLYSNIRLREQRIENGIYDSFIKNEIQIFQQSLRYLIRHNDQEITDYVKFSEKSLKQLRGRQNEQIDQLYLTYKNPVPFKFQFVMDEYIRQLCIKHGMVTKEESKHLAKTQLQNMARQILTTAKHPKDVVDSQFLTEMKGIDYEKINEYLARLDLKKKRAKQLKSQDSKNRGISSRQELGSEYGGNSEVRFQVESKFSHHRGSSSVTENLQLFGNKKHSKSSRRENINSQSYQLQVSKALRTEKSAADLITSNNFHNALNSRNQVADQNRTDFLKSAKTSKEGNSNQVRYKQFLNAQNDRSLNIEHCTTPNSAADKHSFSPQIISQTKAPQILKSQSNGNFLLQSNGNMRGLEELRQFQKSMMSTKSGNAKMHEESVENAYWKMDTKRTTKNGLNESQRLQLSRQSNQSSLRNMKPPQPMNLLSPSKPRILQQRSSQAIPNSMTLRKEVSSPKNIKASMSTLSMGKGSGGSFKETDGGMQTQVKVSASEAQQLQQYFMTTTDQSQTGWSSQGGRKSAQQPATGQMQLGINKPQMVRRAFNQSQQNIALNNPMIIKSPNSGGGASGGANSGGQLSVGHPTPTAIKTPVAANSGSASLIQKQRTLAISSNEGGFSKQLSSPKNLLSPKVPFSKKLSGASSNFSMKNLQSGNNLISASKTRNMFKIGDGEPKHSQTFKTAREAAPQYLKSPSRNTNRKNKAEPAYTMNASANGVDQKHLLQPNSAELAQNGTKLSQLKSQKSSIQSQQKIRNVTPQPGKMLNTVNSVAKLRLEKKQKQDEIEQSDISPIQKQHSAKKPPMTSLRPSLTAAMSPSEPENDTIVLVSPMKKSSTQSGRRKPKVATLDLSKEVRNQKQKTQHEVQKQYYQVQHTPNIKTDDDNAGSGEESPVVLEERNSSPSDGRGSRNSCYSNNLIQASYKGTHSNKLLAGARSQRDTDPQAQNGSIPKPGAQGGFVTQRPSDTTFNISSGATSSPSKVQLGTYATLVNHTATADQIITYQTAQSDSINEGKIGKLGVRHQYQNRKPSMRYDEKPNRESTLSDIAPSPATQAIGKGALAVNAQMYHQFEKNKNKMIKTQRQQDEQASQYTFKNDLEKLKSARQIAEKEPIPLSGPPIRHKQPSAIRKDQYMVYTSEQKQDVQKINSRYSQRNSDLSDQENLTDSSRQGPQQRPAVPTESWPHRKFEHKHQSSTNANNVPANTEISGGGEQGEPNEEHAQNSAKTVSLNQTERSFEKQKQGDERTFQEAQKHMKQNQKHLASEEGGARFNQTLKAVGLKQHDSKYQITGGTPDQIASPWNSKPMSQKVKEVVKFENRNEKITLRVEQPDSRKRLFSPALLDQKQKFTKSPSHQKLSFRGGVAAATAVQSSVRASPMGQHLNSKKKSLIHYLDKNAEQGHKPVQRVSITGNQKQMKKYYNQKFNATAMTGVKQFGQSFQNRLVARSSQISKHEEDISLSQISQRNWQDISAISGNPQRGEIPEKGPGESDESSESQKHEQAYQLKQAKALGATHKKGKRSIFSNENMVPQQEIQESPSMDCFSQDDIQPNFFSQPDETLRRLNDMDPSGEYRIDLHRYYQPNGMISSHIGDIDNEPRTPRSPNLFNSLIHSKSHSHKTSGQKKSSGKNSGGNRQNIQPQYEMVNTTQNQQLYPKSAQKLKNSLTLQIQRVEKV